jgi:hypothetical protein
MKIGKSILLNKYGISLNSGKYQINACGDYYEVYTVKDDTEGCVLVGELLRDDFITHSRATFKTLMDTLLDATHANQVITIEIT